MGPAPRVQAQGRGRLKGAATGKDDEDHRRAGDEDQAKGDETSNETEINAHGHQIPSKLRQA